MNEAPKHSAHYDDNDDWTTIARKVLSATVDPATPPVAQTGTVGSDPSYGRAAKALRLIHDTFVKDESQGYRSRDRQFAIEIAKAALAPQPTGETDLIGWLRKASQTIYLATDEAVANDISPKLAEAADEIAALNGTLVRQGQEIIRWRDRAEQHQMNAEAVKALFETGALLCDLRQGQYIHNDRFPDRKVEGALWDRIPDAIKLIESALSAPTVEGEAPHV